jgi:hypothetical protein
MEMAQKTSFIKAGFSDSILGGGEWSPVFYCLKFQKINPNI